MKNAEFSGIDRRHKKAADSTKRSQQRYKGTCIYIPGHASTPWTETGATIILLLNIGPKSSCSMDREATTAPEGLNGGGRTKDSSRTEPRWALTRCLHKQTLLSKDFFQHRRSSLQCHWKKQAVAPDNVHRAKSAPPVCSCLRIGLHWRKKEARLEHERDGGAKRRSLLRWGGRYVADSGSTWRNTSAQFVHLLQRILSTRQRQQVKGHKEVRGR